MKNLSILIPTFDRPSKTSQRLAEILSIFGSDISVQVQVNPGYFNASHIKVPAGLRNASCRENAVNLGIVANIVSGLSKVESEWVWILGDDDTLLPDIKSRIEQSLDHANEYSCVSIIFNQWHRIDSSGSCICNTMDELCRKTAFTDMLFISGTIWRTSHLRSNIGILIDYSFSRASQALIHFATIIELGRCIYIHQGPLIGAMDPFPRWSRIDYLQRINTIYYHPAMRGYRREITKLMWPQIEWAFESALREVSENKKLIWDWLLCMLKHQSQLLLNRRSWSTIGHALTLDKILIMFAARKCYHKIKMLFPESPT